MTLITTDKSTLTMFIEQKQQTKYSVDARPHFYSEGFKVFQGESVLLFLLFRVGVGGSLSCEALLDGDTDAPLCRFINT